MTEHMSERPDASSERLLQSDDAALDADLLPVVLSLRARAASRPPMGSVTIGQIRARAAAEFEEWNLDPTPIASVSDLVAETAHRRVQLRLYDPRPEVVGGLLVYLHGGGWSIGDLDLEDAALRYLAASSGVRVLSVDYRLLPEHPFPAALEDVSAVVRWLASGAGPTVAADRIALGGASAGANLALGAALKLRDEGGPMPCFLMLLYGAYAGGAETQSLRLFGDGRFGLPREMMGFFWRLYLGDGSAPPHPYAVPLCAELRGLPGAFVSSAGLDALLDDSVALVGRLRECGVPVEHLSYPGAIHGFTQYVKRCALARRSLEDAGRAVSAALG
jgi:acetyl esterase